MKKLVEPVLIVKGPRSHCEKLGPALEQEGFSVFESDQFEKVQSLVQSKSPFLIVSDFDLRGGTALELCQLIKQTHARTPHVIIASDVDKELALAALNSGVDELLETPVSLEQIKRIVLKYSQSRLKQLEREKQESDEAVGLFLDEFEELAMDLDPNIRALTEDVSAVRALVRRVHIIRGAAASLPQGLGAAIAELGLVFEENLTSLQSGQTKPSQPMIDLFLQTSVLLKELVSALKSGEPPKKELSQRLLVAHRTFKLSTHGNDSSQLNKIRLT